MDTSHNALIGSLVPKRAHAIANFHVHSRFEATQACTPPVHQLFGRVVGAVRASVGCECLYHVIYEDGDEAFLPEEEVCMGLLSHIPQRSFSGKASLLAAEGSSNRPPPHTFGAHAGASHAPPAHQWGTMLGHVLTSAKQTVGARCRVESKGLRPFGKVIGLALSLPTGERAFHVVYEDGDEACLCESEVQIMAAACVQAPSVARLPSTSTFPPPVSTSTRRSFTYNTAPTTSTTTSFPRDIQQQMFRASSAMAAPCRWGRQGPSQACMPPRQGLAWASPGNHSANGLFALMVALLIAFFINKGVQLVGHIMGVGDVALWTAPAAVVAKEQMSCFGIHHGCGSAVDINSAWMG